MEDNFRINYDILKTLLKTLNLVKDEDRIDFIDQLLTDAEQAMEDAQHYAKSNNVGYNIALERVIAEKELSLGKYCKYGC